ncbi:MAG: DNA-directed RNA polymerase sigma-70 factor [bacterium]|nr:MAG: DNA-directed RNA polymerase sigma-70 factor [bacterium]
MAKMKLIKRLLKQQEIDDELESRRDRLYRVAWSWCRDSHLADDLTQQALIKALQNIASLRDREMLDAWLFRILSNCWKDHLRAQKETIDIDDAGLIGNSSPEEQHHESQIVLRIRRAIAELPEKQRQVVTLVDLAELTYNEVSEALEIPIGTVMSRLCRARQTLRSSLVELNQSHGNTGLRLRRVK